MKIYFKEAQLWKELQWEIWSIPVDSDSCNGEKAYTNVSISQERYKDAEESYICPTCIYESDGIERQYEKAKHEVCYTETVIIINQNFDLLWSCVYKNTNIMDTYVDNNIIF